jgi:DNA-directed RNA polymerase subunit F
MIESNREQLSLLEGYRMLTQQMDDLVHNAVDDLIDIERMEELLAERDRLLQFLRRVEEPVPGELREIVREIRNLEQKLIENLALLRERTQAKVQGIQSGRRMRDAYNPAIDLGSAFFDQKK